MDIALYAGLFRYLEFLGKFTDQLDRRLLKGETIPHQEKVFSIFEEYTEWITKELYDWFLKYDKRMRN